MTNNNFKNPGPTDTINIQDSFEIHSSNDTVVEQPTINHGQESVITPLDYNEKQDVVETPDNIKEEIIESIKTPEEEVLMEETDISGDEIPYITVNFKNNTSQVQYTVLGTCVKDKIMAVNGKLTLIHGRGYLIPITKDMNSDYFSCVKTYSEYSHKIDIRYTKDGYAFIIPIQNNIVVSHNQVIGILV